MCRRKIKIGNIFLSNMEEVEDEDGSSGRFWKGLLLFLIFIFPPLVLVALPLLPFWLMEKKKDSVPSPEPTDIPLLSGSCPKPPDRNIGFFRQSPTTMARRIYGGMSMTCLSAQSTTGRRASGGTFRTKVRFFHSWEDKSHLHSGDRVCQRGSWRGVAWLV